MKTIRSFVLIMMWVIIPLIIFAQPDPRLNGNGTSVGNTPVGATGAPVDGGFTILLSLALVYSARQLYRQKKSNPES